MPCTGGRSSECHILFTIMLSAIMLNAIRLSVVMLNVFMSVVAPTFWSSGMPVLLACSSRCHFGPVSLPSE
jgi:hypothetical protein